MTIHRDLAGFSGQGYDIGRPKIVQVAWLVISGLIFKRWWCPASLRAAILRAFGATLGKGVLVRHEVTVHWPWKLSVGDHTWIGQRSWLLNLETITIGADVCISQDAFICTGSHDRRSPTFEFDNGPIHIGDGAWVAARAVVLRGVTVGEGAVVPAGSVVSRDVAPGAVANR